MNAAKDNAFQIETDCFIRSIILFSIWDSGIARSYNFNADWYQTLETSAIKGIAC